MRRILWLCMLVGLCLSSAFTQQSLTGTSPSGVNATVPTLVNVSGTLTDVNGKPLTGVVGVTLYLYKDRQDGAPLWMETQNVQPDKTGHYTVMLGSTKSQGLPTDVFFSGEARWLGVQAQGQAEQPRVLLLSVPYALKAGDAQTVGGLPPSAFVLAVPASLAESANGASSVATMASAPPPASSNVTTTGGTANTIPMFTTATNIQNSILTQTSTTAINVRGKLNLPATRTATASKGFNSQVQDFVASVFNSGTSKPVAQTFQWQAEPVNNDRNTASGTLNLLYASGTATPVETGLTISNKGLFTFATGQTFPGTGTIDSVKAGDDLTGGGSSGTVTLNLDTTKVPQLKAANTFTGNQTINGNLSEAGNITATGLVSGNSATFAGNISSSANITNSGSISSGGSVSATGNGLGVFMGNVGCSAPTIGIQSTGLTANCQNFIVGFDGSQNSTYINRPTGGALHFREGNVTDQVTILSGGQVGIGTQTPNAMLEVDGAPETGFAGGEFVGSSSAGGNPGGAGGVFFGGCSGFACGGPGVLAFVDASGDPGLAGDFVGDIDVSGAVNAGTKDFKIDHPLDPANKYLYHASVESSEMMNIYTGNVSTNSQGKATVRFPEWFEVLNTDFRYQLTVIGQFAQAIVAHKIENNEFEIRTNAPNVEVSWQVTGVRHDVYAKAHPLVVEQEKDTRLKGFYIHPELYGAPKEKQIEWARHPKTMKRIKERQTRSTVPTMH